MAKRRLPREPAWSTTFVVNVLRTDWLMTAYTVLYATVATKRSVLIVDSARIATPTRITVPFATTVSALTKE